ncbi:hypothetical protein [Blastococcus sp. SYSU DS0828]
MTADRQQDAEASTAYQFLTTKRSIRDVGKRLRDEQERPSDRDALTEYRGFNAQNLSAVHGEVRDALNEVPFLLACRVKRLDSIVRKLRRERSMTLERMDDICGLRVIVPSRAAQAAAVDAISSRLGPSRTRNYVEAPPNSGYRAVHLIVDNALSLPEGEGPSVFRYEIQVRTYFQHLWSSTSESFGERVKEGGGSRPVRSYLDELSRRIDSLESEDPSRSQMVVEPQTGALNYFAVQFDHSGEQLVRLDSLGENLRQTLRRFSYLEGLSRDTLTREVVLLGSASSEEQLRVTHIRYFAPRGIPDLPPELRPPELRPG